MATPTPTPTRVKINRTVYYRVRLGKKWTGKEGPPQTKYCETWAEATDWIEKEAAALKAGGQDVYDLSKSQRQDALEAYKVLKRVEHLGPLPSLVKVAEDYVKRRSPGGQIPFKDAVPLFLESRSEESPVYRTELRRQCTLFAETWGERIMSDITAKDVSEFLKAPRFSKEYQNRVGDKVKPSWTAKTRNNMRLTLSAMWVYGMKRDQGWVAENIILDVTKAKEREKLPGIVTPGVFKKILVGALEVDAEYLPFLVISGFLGIRRSEVMRLEWSDILWSQGQVAVSKTKNLDFRYVDLPQAVPAWLSNYRNYEGYILPGMVWGTGLSKADEEKQQQQNDSKELDRRTRLLRHLDLELPQNVIRHSGASYALALKKDYGAVAYQMGHEASVLKRKYKHPLTHEDGIAWFSMFP